MPRKELNKELTFDYEDSETLERLLLAGLESGEAVPVDSAWWDQRRSNLMKRCREDSKPPDNIIRRNYHVIEEF